MYFTVFNKLTFFGDNENYLYHWEMYIYVYLIKTSSVSKIVFETKTFEQ